MFKKIIEDADKQKGAKGGKSRGQGAGKGNGGGLGKGQAGQLTPRTSEKAVKQYQANVAIGGNANANAAAAAATKAKAQIAEDVAFAATGRQDLW